jgi:hypothetical protein
LNSMLSTVTERNAVDAALTRAAAGSRREMRVNVAQSSKGSFVKRRPALKAAPFRTES